MTQTLKVEGMACAHCASRVEKAASAVEGVASAKADVNAATLTVEGNADAAAVAAAVTAAGYPCTAN